MSNEQNILTNTAERLGIQEDSTLTKAKEFLRLLHSKGSIKTLSDITKTVLCLDLASLFSNTGFDKETALKLTGLKKSVYQNNLHSVEKVLGLDKPVTITELCVQLSCTSIKDVAEEIFEKYKTTNNKIRDLDHPQYVTVSVYAACKLNNVKINKSHFITNSRLKPAQWKELTNEFDKFIISFGIATSSQKRKKREELDSVIEKLADDIGDKIVLKRKETDEDEVEDYEVWKKRILDEAYKALGRPVQTE